MSRLIRQLTDGDAARRRAAEEDVAALLAGEDGGYALAEIEVSLLGAERERKVALIRCLAAWADPRALRPLAAQLDSEDKWTKLCALAALRRFEIDDSLLADRMRDLLSDSDPQVRREAALAAGHLKDRDPASSDALITMLQSDDKGLRENALWALEQISGKQLGADPARWQAWQETNREVREEEEKRREDRPRVYRELVRQVAQPRREGETTVEAVRMPLTMVGLVLLLVLSTSVWLVMPGWLGSKMKSRERRQSPEAKLNDMVLAREFLVSDYVPDFVFYPVVLRAVENGSRARLEIALRLLQLRAFGGCRRALGGLKVRADRPARNAAQWISRLPRMLLEDLAVLRGPGSSLIRVLDPENPRWRKAPTRDDLRMAQRSYASWLAKRG
jgi:hypothetical protein